MFDFPVVPVGKKPKSLPAYIVAGNGIFLRKESALGITQTRVSNVGHLPAMEPELTYTLPPIPKKLSAQIAGFLLKVDKVFHCEGALLLCLDQKGKWRIVVPRQDPSGADVRYFVDEDTVPKNWLLAGTVHSHPFNKSSAPTASWTDENDERKIDGVHLVAGSLEHEPKYGAAVVVNGTRFKYQNWQDLITPAEPDIEAVPDEWLEKIEKNKPGGIAKAISKVTSWGGGSSYTYVPDYYPKEGETVEQAIGRAREHSFKWINEDLAKLGYKLVWSVEELPAGATAVQEATSGVTTLTDTVTMGAGGVPVSSSLTPTADSNSECECLTCDCGIRTRLSAVGDRLVCYLCLEGNHGQKKPKKNGKSKGKGKTNGAAVTSGSVDTPSGPMRFQVQLDPDGAAVSSEDMTICPQCPHYMSEHDAMGCFTHEGGSGGWCECKLTFGKELGQSVLPIEEPPREGEKWRNASPIACKDKHPGKNCPVDKKNPEVTNCGCHCEPCRTHTVGAYNAADANLPESEDEWVHHRPPEDDECQCDECSGGCYAFLGINAPEDKTLCNDCQRGSHYKEDGTIGSPNDDIVYDEALI